MRFSKIVAKRLALYPHIDRRTLYPMGTRTGSVAAHVFRRRYLGEIAEVGRWPIARQRFTAGKLNVSITHSPPSLTLVPEPKGPSRSGEERAFLVKAFRAHTTRRDPKVNVARSPREGEETVICRYMAIGDPRASDHGLILGDGEILTPNLLLGVQSGGSPGPIRLFLNACQSGTGAKVWADRGFPRHPGTEQRRAVIAPPLGNRRS
jgi:hypothetical protein